MLAWFVWQLLYPQARGFFFNMMFEEFPGSCVKEECQFVWCFGKGTESAVGVVHSV